jgi:hypothetical protein
MFNKTMSQWFDSFDSDQPTSDGPWANAWSPVWDDASGAPSSAHSVEASAQAHPRLSRRSNDAKYVGSTLNHG